MAISVKTVNESLHFSFDLWKTFASCLHDSSIPIEGYMCLSHGFWTRTSRLISFACDRNFKVVRFSGRSWKTMRKYRRNASSKMSHQTPVARKRNEFLSTVRVSAVVEILVGMGHGDPRDTAPTVASRQTTNTTSLPNVNIASENKLSVIR